MSHDMEQPARLWLADLIDEIRAAYESTGNPSIVIEFGGSELELRFTKVAINRDNTDQSFILLGNKQ